MALTNNQKRLIDLLHDIGFEPDIIIDLISKIKDKENLRNLLNEIGVYKNKNDKKSRNMVIEILKNYSF